MKRNLSLQLIFAIITCAFFSIARAQMPVYMWTHSYGGGGQGFNYLTTDDSGNVYATGLFSGSVDFAPGTPVYNLTTTNAPDLYICKIRPSGALQWAHALNGTGDAIGHSIAVDDSGNVYVSGTFRETADFDFGAGVTSFTAPFMLSDLFILKLKNNGEFVWAKRTESLGGTIYYSKLAVDAAHNVYIGGAYSNLIDFDGGSGVASHNSVSGSEEAFLLKLGIDGEFNWVKIISGEYNQWIYDVKIDANNDVYISGNFKDSTDFDPGPGTNIIYSPEGNAYLAKLDSAGFVNWVKVLHESLLYAENYIDLDLDGNIYMSGTFNDTVDMDPGPGVTEFISYASDAFITKYTNSGDLIWARNFGNGYSARGWGIDVDDTGNVYTAGLFSNIMDLDPGGDTVNFTSQGYQDIYVSKLDSAGNYRWAEGMGSQGTDWGTTVSVSKSSDIYVGGFYQWTVDFDPGSPVDNHTATSEDNFIQHFTYTPPIVNVNELSTFSHAELYPNPATDKIVLKPGYRVRDAVVELYTVTGQVLYHSRFSGDSYTVNLSRHATGMYYLKISAGNAARTFKVVKQ